MYILNIMLPAGKHESWKQKLTDAGVRFPNQDPETANIWTTYHGCEVSDFLFDSYLKPKWGELKWVKMSHTADKPQVLTAHYSTLARLAQEMINDYKGLRDDTGIARPFLLNQLITLGGAASLLREKGTVPEWLKAETELEPGEVDMESMSTGDPITDFAIAFIKTFKEHEDPALWGLCNMRVEDYNKGKAGE